MLSKSTWEKSVGFSGEGKKKKTTQGCLLILSNPRARQTLLDEMNIKKYCCGMWNQSSLNQGMNSPAREGGIAHVQSAK